MYIHVYTNIKVYIYTIRAHVNMLTCTGICIYTGIHTHTHSILISKRCGHTAKEREPINIAAINPIVAILSKYMHMQQKKDTE